MSTTRWSVVTACLALALGCGPATFEPELFLSSSKSTFDGRVDHVVLKVQAVTRTGALGQGVVTFVSPAGRFAESADVTLVDGFATVSFLCDPAEDTACGGSMRLSATWQGLSANVQVRVTPSTREAALRWKVRPTHSLATLSALAVAPDNSLYAVGTGGAVLRLVGTEWLTQFSPTTEDLTAVTVTAAGTPIVVGKRGTLLVGQSGRLTVVPTGLDDEHFTSVAATSETSIEVGSASGTLFHFDGSTMAAAFSLGVPVLSLARVGGSTWAGGEGVFGVHDGTSWTSQASPVLARFSAALTSADEVFMAGARMDAPGGVLLVGPSAWRAATLDEPITALAIVPKGDERFALGANSVYRQIGEGAWSWVDAPAGGLAAVSRFANDLVIVGAPGFCLMRE